MMAPRSCEFSQRPSSVFGALARSTYRMSVGPKPDISTSTGSVPVRARPDAPYHRRLADERKGSAAPITLEVREARWQHWTARGCLDAAARCCHGTSALKQALLPVIHGLAFE